MSAATEVDSVIGPMMHAKKNLKKWMKTEKRKAAIAPLGSALSLLGAKAEIRYQPKAVLRANSQRNFPLILALAPYADTKRKSYNARQYDCLLYTSPSPRDS